MSNKKLVITKVNIDLPGVTKKPVLFRGLFNEQGLEEVFCEKETSFTPFGTICIGRVENIVPSIGGAFIRITPEELAYLPMKEASDGIFSKKSSKKDLCIGDELLVQVCREPIKTKGSTLTTYLQIPGKYMVLTTDSSGIQVSKKILGEPRKELKKHYESLIKEVSLDELPVKYGIIVRTNAAEASNEDIHQEFQRIHHQFRSIVCEGIHKSLYSKLLVPDSPMLRRILDFLPSEEVEIITDLPDIYQEILEAGVINHQLSLRLYNDSYGLDKLYSLSTHLDKVLSTKVWLKSGAYLIIEPTEALTVIDVNSGKNVKAKKDENFFLNVNLEAEAEIMEQIRLRNLSGIIVIDFIDMPNKEQQQQLIHKLNQDCKRERIPTSFVELTKLNLAHVVRKKVHQTLREQVKE